MAIFDRHTVNSPKGMVAGHAGVLLRLPNNPTKLNDVKCQWMLSYILLRHEYLEMDGWLTYGERRLEMVDFMHEFGTWETNLEMLMMYGCSGHGWLFWNEQRISTYLEMKDAGFPSTIQMFDCVVGFGLIQDGGFPRLPRLPGMDDLTHHGLDVQKLLGETMAKRSATSVPFRDSQTSSRPRLWPLWWASTCAQDCRTAMSFWERMGKDGENVRYLGRFCPCLWLYGVFGLPFWQTNFQAGRFCLSRFG